MKPSFLLHTVVDIECDLTQRSKVANRIDAL